MPDFRIFLRIVYNGLQLQVVGTKYLPTFLYLQTFIKSTNFNCGLQHSLLKTLKDTTGGGKHN